MASAFLLGVPLALLLWVRWFFTLRISGVTAPKRSMRIGLAVLLPLACGILLAGVLAKWSAADVRSDPEAMAEYWALGLVWVALAQRVFAFLGISARDDVIERRNPAAALVIVGQLVAATCCFAGANIGNGPGVEVVLFCAALSTASLLVLWVMFDRIAWMVDTVTIERNSGAGIRAAGWMVATGIVLGAGVAGDWESVGRTVIEFAAYVWPAAAFTAAAAVLELRLRKNATNSWSNQVSYSTGMALAYMALAVFYVYKRGLW